MNKPKYFWSLVPYVLICSQIRLHQDVEIKYYHKIRIRHLTKRIISLILKIEYIRTSVL